MIIFYMIINNIFLKNTSTYNYKLLTNKQTLKTNHSIIPSFHHSTYPYTPYSFFTICTTSSSIST